ncbi:MAG TPA: phosphoglycerate kinase [Bacteroidetes bacterium]|jgi:phosphoglycerate kinase|nr:MAG: phosphoglycerate kinase [Sphingobacteriales bacterium BACL12 MAG-120802-bin5]HCK20731.1 phosphoglycerate kinase [Bacteroidota bacterium]
MQTVNDFDFNGKKALIRVDFNVPLDKETLAVTDDNRLRAALPTIRKILEDGGSVILMSHLGRPKEGPEDRFSMRHVIGRLSDLLHLPVQFAENCIGTVAQQAAAALQPGEVLLLENLRFHKEETKGDVAFAEQLAALGDVYVNDAFGTAHRAHASTTIIAQFFDQKHKMAGLLMAGEVTAGTKVLHHADKPFTAIIGGAKVSDKIMILEKLLDIADNIIIGGGMAYTFYKAKGGNIGASLCEEDRLETAKSLLEKAAAKGVSVYLPEDSIVADAFSADAQTQTTASDAIPEGWMGLDIGPAALREYLVVIAQSMTIMWNGPMGVFEMEAFSKGTIEVAQAIARATAQGAYSLVGGGDSVAAVNKFHLADKVSYVSTGGGAMLEFFEGKELPGVAALS